MKCSHMKSTVMVLFWALCSLHQIVGQSSGIDKPKPKRPDIGILDLTVTAIDGYPENKTVPTVQSYTFKYSATVINYGEKITSATSLKIKLEIMNGQEVLIFNKTHSIGKLGPEEEKHISGQFTFNGTWLYWYTVKGTINPITGDLNAYNNSKKIEKVLRID